MDVTIIEDAVEAGIEAASEYVSSLPSGQKTWDTKEYKIAETAARAAIAALQGSANGCMWCRYGDHPSGPVCPVHQASREPTDADYWDAIYDRGQR